MTKGRVIACAMLAGTFVFWACSDNTVGTSSLTEPGSGPRGGSPADQADVLAALTAQAGAMVAFDFGESGGVATQPEPPTSASPSISAAPAEGSIPAFLPEFWGRIQVVDGGPQPVVHQDVTILNDTATVLLTVSFQGLFVDDTTDDGVFDPKTKPLNDDVVQEAVFVRDQGMEHHWRLVELSPQNWVTTAEARRTVAIQDVKVFVNDELRLDLTDPSALFHLETTFVHLDPGDVVKIDATVENSTSTLDDEFTPNTFAFLQVRHFDQDADHWGRIPMTDLGSGLFETSFTAGQVGRNARDRFVVDALDAATLDLATVDNYRANEWGIPFGIGEAGRIPPAQQMPPGRVPPTQPPPGHTPLGPLSGRG